MAEQHRATDLQWDRIKARTSDKAAYSTILELLCRIEALEAAAQPNYPEKPDSSLKGRIKSRMIDNIGSTWEVISASVLVEVAAWLRDHYGGTTATTDLLEQEAER